MNTFVSGESDAKGLSVILPYIAVDPAAVAIRRPEFLEPLGIWFGVARLGAAWPGLARQGIWLGSAGQGAAVQGAARQGKEYGKARLGKAGRGQAWPGAVWQGTWAGVTTSKHKTHTEHGNNTTQH